MQIWKRNAVVAAVVLFVCIAVYLTWSYNRQEDTPVLNPFGQSTTESAKTGSSQPTTATNTTPGASSQSGETATTAPAVRSDNPYFDEARLARQQARDSALSVLRENTTNDAVGQEAREQAMAEMEVLAGDALTEARIEGLVKAKGFVDCVVYLNEDAVNVIVTSPASGLIASDVAKIRDVVISETGGKTVDIKVVEIR